MFGVGWGVGGICPGPALVAVSTLQPQVLAFVAAMVMGMRLDSAIAAAGLLNGRRGAAKA